VSQEISIEPATHVVADPAVSMRIDARTQGLNLFLVGFLVLFFELACIRWFATYVVFLQFFTNVVLLASFLGMSCGCLAARQRRDWLGYFPLLAFGAVWAAIMMMSAYQNWSGLAVDVGHQASPQEVFFGTEYRSPDVAKFSVPIEVIVAFFFILIALMFVGLGQVLGRAFDAYPDRVRGYTLNIGGSLVGIVGFSLISFIGAPPIVWFVICCAGIAYLLHQAGSLTTSRGLLLASMIALVFAIPVVRDYRGGSETRWSPYYAVSHIFATGSIVVNDIGHQQMVPFAKGGPQYSLIHLLQKYSGGAPFKDMLVIGAGSGNDLDHALHFGVERIDAVEIDPVIQGIGIHENIDHPYQDPRVVPHLDDGRHFLRTADRQYDLVVYALVDSLILHSGYSNIRLESYLFTEQAFADIARRLKPGGIFVTYNYFRQGWIVERVAAMAKQAFGCEPIVLSLPYREELKASSPAGFTMVIAGCNQQIADAFKRHPNFWLNEMPGANLAVDGFAVRPETLPPEERAQWLRIAPTKLIADEGTPIAATDDWPFPYLQGKLIPDLSLRSMALLGGLGIALVYFFMPKGRIQLHSRMFFLGAAFMLLETKAVVQLALLFGSTWLVNSLVFFTVLVLILLANLYVLKIPNIRLSRHYAGLLAFLLVAVLVPLDAFLDGGMLWRYAVPCLLALGPVFFAGVIFARSFRDTTDPDQAFGSNIAGAVVGGLSESLSMLLGFRYLLLLAVLFYVLSACVPSFRTRAIN
jgi:SAM-dependent methyltransferase